MRATHCARTHDGLSLATTDALGFGLRFGACHPAPDISALDATNTTECAAYSTEDSFKVAHTHLPGTRPLLILSVSVGLILSSDDNSHAGNRYHELTAEDSSAELPGRQADPSSDPPQDDRHSLFRPLIQPLGSFKGHAPELEACVVRSLYL